MKNLLFTLALLVSVVLTSIAQTPQLFNYQATLRNNNGQLLVSDDISVRISILQNSTDGTTVYSETHAVTTTSQGIVNLKIGSGTSTDEFTVIDWSHGPYFLKIEIDIENTGTYAELGVTQLISVPYALFAEKAYEANYADTAEVIKKSDWMRSDNHLYYLQGNVGIGRNSFESLYNPKLWLHNGWLQVSDSTNHDAGIVVSHLNKFGYGYARTVHQVYEGVNGDPYTEFRIRGNNDDNTVTSWSVGADNDDGDKFKINLRTDHPSGSSPSYGNNILTLTTAGNLGIGTNNPSYRLNVVSTSSDYDNESRNIVLIQNLSTSNSAFAGLGIRADDNDHGVNLSFTSSNYSLIEDMKSSAALSTNGNALALSTTSPNGSIRFLSNPYQSGLIEMMRLDVNGNLGLGTKNPKAKFEIADGDIYIKDIDKGIIMTSPDGQCWRGTINNSGVLEFVAVECP